MTDLPPAILFDWDNTLIDTFPVLFAAHNAVRAELGATPWSENDARANIRLAAKDAFPLWYGDRAGQAEAAYVAYIRAHHLNHLHVFDGTAELLALLHARRVPMAVVSNKRGEFLRAEVEAARFSPYFQCLIGADDLNGPGKPSPEGVLKAMNCLNLPETARSAAWYVGDTENDLKTARAAGVQPVFIENIPMCDPGQVAALSPLITFKNPRECLAYFDTVG